LGGLQTINCAHPPESLLVTYCIHTHNTDSLRIASRWSRVLRTGLGSWCFSQIIALPLHIVREVLTKSRFKAPFSSCHLAHSTRGVSKVEVRGVIIKLSTDTITSTFWSCIADKIVGSSDACSLYVGMITVIGRKHI
jgi:hypothetical protein